MKKLTALLLALCMLLAVVPALGEDLSGTWYMVVEDVNIGTLELNADGAFSMTVQASGEANTVEGTWEATDAGMTLTANGDPAEAIYDAEAGTLTIAEFPIPMQREKGKYEVQLMIDVLTMKEDIEFPEGVTQLEASTAALKFIAKLNELEGTIEGTGTGTGTEDGGTPDATKAPAGEAEADILAENFIITKSYSGFTGRYIAKLQNNTDAPFFITDGSMQLTDKNGKVVGEAKWLYPTASKYLEPGEITFVSLQADLDEEVEVDVAKHVVVKSESYSNTDYAVPVENPTFVRGKSEYDSDTMRVIVVNDTDEYLPGIEAVFVLEDADGKPLYMTTESLYRYELGPHSSIALVSSVDNHVLDYCAQNGIEPAAVEVYAWVENKDW